MFSCVWQLKTNEHDDDDDDGDDDDDESEIVARCWRGLQHLTVTVAQQSDMIQFQSHLLCRRYQLSCDINRSN